MIADLLVVVLVLIGAFFTLLGSLGLLRFPDLFTRLHAPTKATTLGVGSILLGSMVYFTVRGNGLSVHEILIGVFLFITAPVSAHLLARAALHLKLDSLCPRPSDDDPE